eukprot:gnl/MRDRNA2_/MRDRNA2_95934_c0_seq1.p1 gnl/MRDRNA2_/MRDRNA2_95934_c0~~gnl/MRDRNA2_/MRDRNA2_95934_c0_seq1.p1  ORF type:complete len:150 (-),score=3.60 gnl/MRDRNA2_/MRDRNA2_95934_c0_seq1:16-465(-)
MCSGIVAVLLAILLHVRASHQMTWHSAADTQDDLLDRALMVGHVNGTDLDKTMLAKPRNNTNSTNGFWNRVRSFFRRTTSTTTTTLLSTTPIATTVSTSKTPKPSTTTADPWSKPDKKCEKGRSHVCPCPCSCSWPCAKKPWKCPCVDT